MDNFLGRNAIHLVKKIPDVKFLIIGGVPEQIKNKIEKLGLKKNIIDIGVLSEEDLIKTYYTLDVLAHSARRGESFGITIAEAMAAGKPVVVNSTPWADNAQIELVDNNETGLVANTPRTYADAVAFLLENKNEANRMGTKGKEKAKREYDSKRAAKMCEKLYLELLTKKGEKIDKETLQRYENIEYFPTNSDILSYSKQYKKRVLSQFERPTLAEKLSFEIRYKGKLRAWKHSIQRIYGRVT